MRKLSIMSYAIAALMSTTVQQHVTCQQHEDSQPEKEVDDTKSTKSDDSDDLYDFTNYIPEHYDELLEMKKAIEDIEAEKNQIKFKSFTSTCDRVKIKNMASGQFLSQRYLNFSGKDKKEECMYVGMTGEDLDMINKFVAEENLDVAQPMFSSNEIFQILNVPGEEDAFKIKGLYGGMLVLSLRQSSYLGCTDKESRDEISTTNFVFNQGLHEGTWLIEAVFGELWDYSRFLSQSYQKSTGKSGDVDSLISIDGLDELRTYAELTDNKQYLWQVECAIDELNQQEQLQLNNETQNINKGNSSEEIYTANEDQQINDEIRLGYTDDL